MLNVMIDVDQAIAHIQRVFPVSTTTNVGLRQSLGMVVATDIHAKYDQPPFAQVALDGYAIDANSVVKSAIVTGMQAAGDVPLDVSPGKAVEIMTGAMLANGANTVVPYEHTSRLDDVITITEPYSRGDAIRQQGETTQQGDVILPQGSIVNSANISLLAANGYATLPVYQQPTVSLMTSGDEVIPVDATRALQQIHSSHEYAIGAVCADFGWEVVAHRHVEDCIATTITTIKQLVSSSNIVLLTGGVSKGKYDHVVAALQQLGATIYFHGVKLRPGKPLLAASLDGALIIGLPGNPQSAIICTRRFVIEPWLSRYVAKHRQVHKLLAEPSNFSKDLTLFALGRIDDLGKIQLVANSGSGDVVALSNSDGFVELPYSQQQHGGFPIGFSGKWFGWGR